MFSLSLNFLTFKIPDKFYPGSLNIARDHTSLFHIHICQNIICFHFLKTNSFTFKRLLLLNSSGPHFIIPSFSSSALYNVCTIFHSFTFNLNFVNNLWSILFIRCLWYFRNSSISIPLRGCLHFDKMCKHCQRHSGPRASS